MCWPLFSKLGKSLWDGVADFRFTLPLYVISPNDFNLNLPKQYNGPKICLVVWLPLSHGDGKHSVANLKWLQAAKRGGY